MKNSSRIKKKNCFIITPIGERGSIIRKRVDQWEKLIYNPAIGDKFELIYAHKISAPGIITEQILQHIINAELVMIDFTDKNPNVMYEAAIRHITHKQFIQIYPITQSLPFDIHYLRAIPYDPESLEYPSKLVKDIKKSYISMQSSDYKVPEILPQKFDLDRICSDPEKFVKLLKEHLVSSSVKDDTLINKQQNIIEIYENSWLSPFKDSLASLGISTETIKCPKCGVIQHFNKSLFNNDILLATGGSKHYKCNNCGTEFSV